MVKERVNKLNQLLNNEERIDLKLSYSRLSDFDRNGPKALVKKVTENNDGMKFGSITDDLLFNNKEYFDERYVLFDGEKPTATLGVLVDIILKNYPVQPNRDEVLEIVRHNKFWDNIKDVDKLIAKFNNKEFWTYLDCYYSNKDKIMITSDDYYTAIETISVLRIHKFSKHIFNNDFENLDQFAFEFEYKNFTFRGVIDRLSIDHKNKIVYEIDLKTGKNSCLEFEKSFIDYRYYFQECVYTLAFDSICKRLGLKGYTLAPFQFLYISRAEKLPIVWKVSEKWHKAALNGFKIGKYQYKGVNEIIDDIYYYWKNNQYIIPKVVDENNGSLFIRDNFIEINE